MKLPDPVIIILTALLLIMLGFVSGFLKIPILLRYEVALAIIATVVTTIIIFINFEITFPSQVYREDYKTAQDVLLKFKEEYKDGIPLGKPLIVISTGMKVRDVLKNQIEFIKGRTHHALLGIFIIIFLILQIFFWYIDEQNRISIPDVGLLFSSLLFVFFWIFLSIYGIYQDNVELFEELLDKVDEIEGSTDNKNQKGDQRENNKK